MHLIKDYLELHFLVVLWSSTAILGVLITLPPVELVLFRTILSAVFLAFLLPFRGASFRIGKKWIVYMLLTGLLVGAHWITFFWSARVANVSVSLAGFATIALWTSILEPIILKKKFHWYELLLGALVVTGLYVILKFEFNYAWGLALAVISAFLVALFVVLNGKWVQKFDHYTINFYEMIGASISIFVILPWYASSSPDGLRLNPTTQDWLYLLVLSLICTVYAYSKAVELMKRLSAFAISLTVNLEPVYGIIMAVIIFGEKERMTTGFYWGTGIILIAVLTYPLLAYYLPDQRQSKKE